MASRLPTMFKLPGYTIFEYRPRYYDEKKTAEKKLEEVLKLGKGRLKEIAFWLIILEKKKLISEKNRFS
mgnify:CR=1 FL=1